MAQKMDKATYQAFMQEGTRTGKLATVREDGRPHVVPVWFVMDGDDVIFTTMNNTVKGKNIIRDPRVTISVDEQKPGYSFVMFEGEAEILDPTPEEQLEWTTKIARRYMGDELAEEYGKRNAVPDELLVRVKSTSVVAFADVAGY